MSEAPAPRVGRRAPDAAGTADRPKATANDASSAVVCMARHLGLGGEAGTPGADTWPTTCVQRLKPREWVAR